MRRGGSARAPRSRSPTLGEFAVKPLGGHPYASFADLPGRAGIALVAGALLAGLAFAGVRLARTGSGRPQVADPGVLLLLLAIGPVVAIVLYSSQPDASFLLSRNASVAAPYALLIFGWLLAQAPPTRVAGAISTVALAVVTFAGLQMLGTGYERPDARSAAAFIDARARPDSQVVDVPGPHAIRTYLGPQRQVSTYEQFTAGMWGAAERRGVPVYVTYPAAGVFVGGVGPPKAVAGRFRRIASYRSAGVPFGVGVRGYAARGP